MEFAINYNNGYVVCLVAYDETWKRKRFFPLRNFGEHQGDARLFKEADCPDLTDAHKNTPFGDDMDYKAFLESYFNVSLDGI